MILYISSQKSYLDPHLIYSKRHVGIPLKDQITMTTIYIKIEYLREYLRHFKTRNKLGTVSRFENEPSVYLSYLCKAFVIVICYRQWQTF